MGLSAALYSGTSGLRAHGEAMSVIGNNISNVSTIGFKGSRMHFEDALNQEITTAVGVGQVGRGVAIGTVMTDFAQGSLETTTESTDLAIGGNGFFIVSPKDEETQYYTRAGNFRFDKDGYLVDPHGYVVQGWEVLQEDTSSAATVEQAASQTASIKTRGVPTDIRLENFQSPPQPTSRVSMVVNLDSQSEDRSTDKADPFFAMFKKWSANASVPIGDTAYAYQSTIKVYDENGTSHNLTVYFDPVREDITDTGGKQYWEFMVTVPPNEDNRSFWSSVTNTDKKGVLMIGSLTFNTAGEVENMSAFTLNNNNVTLSDPNNLNEWEPALFSQNGYPICTANFLAATGADFTDGANAKNIEINFGIRNKDLSDPDGTGPKYPGWYDPDTTDYTDPSEIGTDQTKLIGFLDPEYGALSTTTYSTGSTTLYQSQDGYTAGFLQNISVDRDGVITGRYSNGQILPLYVLTLADFNNKYALHREGGNLFSQTRESGPPLTGLPGTGGKGTIASNSLEQSNVDLAKEFVKMITTEKGFQANSKTITTTDQMLSVLIQLKR
ncbi:flagellar hook protein FlgE [Desulfohalobiaceae bacterium Ax17]|jgi:flagellar hook protein FlgE|uniref:flagellar hook protein FlgE n=1 Tax=Desulfovulcanus ferrireducens TaxID=2831190 RepID=UPI00207B9D3B|nr:flagellar hook protein FlgE [Desulfovulcanus ferrireducens]MBT8764203.1 flagellar hook protein FlgE [Desulfovulcanus ferrireducens]